VQVLDVGLAEAGMAPGQVVQRGHSIIIASGAEIIPLCTIDHTAGTALAGDVWAGGSGRAPLRLTGRAGLTEDDFAAAACALAAVRDDEDQGGRR
jgi:hypothetical protein